MHISAMQKLAQETKEHITSYIYTKPDLSTLSMVDRSFSNACRHIRYATVHLSAGSSFTLLFCAADIQGYDRRCLGMVVAISHAIRYDFPRVGKYIRRIIFFAEYLKRADILAFIQLMEGAPSVTELVFVDMDLGFFKSSLQLLLSSMKILSILTFKGHSISTQTLNTIAEASPRLTTWNFGCTNNYNVTMDEMTLDMHLALGQVHQLHIGFHSVGWEGDLLSYGWIGRYTFAFLQNLGLHLHHEADVDMANMLLDGMLIVTRLDLQIWSYHSPKYSSSHSRLCLKPLIHLKDFDITVQGEHVICLLQRHGLLESLPVLLIALLR
ncbi:hypothetical protein EDD85DRAFT_955317 [Armillaria nabsnona]|nr:hypothetical protein EDD85DRAFT_955317 [Armillaria nabsnona]